MANPNDKINQLHDKLDSLLKRQEDFSREINKIRLEINALKTTDVQGNKEKEPVQQKVITVQPDQSKQDKIERTPQPVQTSRKAIPEQKPTETPKPLKRKSDIEKFIGENLINKIGIVITVIGVGIGAKYSIENELISPLTRIILGYLFGLGLLGFGFQLKQKYENYSAVLVSGAMAIMYFISFFAYSFYDLIPQGLAFVLMLCFTVFTVFAALNYNKTIIAHIGLVGSYAVPFLLSDGSGRVAILFTYITIINVGILGIAFTKYWKSLYYSSFGLTWLIYLLWYVSEYNEANHFALALVFLSVFFVIFYLTFLAYKLLQKEQFKSVDIVLLMVNSFLFYGMGYVLLSQHELGEQLLGLFTLVNAVIHFIVGLVIHRQKLADQNLFYLVVGLVLVFVSIAIPVQMDGNWVTLLWVGQAALLFWIGRTKGVSFYEKLSFPVMLLAFISIVDDWSSVYEAYDPQFPETRLTLLWNINFLTSVVFIFAFGFINWIHQNKKYSAPIHLAKGIYKAFIFFIAGVFLLVFYYAFRIEIANYWDQLYLDSELIITGENSNFPNYYSNYDLKKYKHIWLINYSLFFVSVLGLVNIKKVKNKLLGKVNLMLILLALIVFLTQGLYNLSELRESYLDQTLAEYYERGVFNMLIRYVSFAFVSLSLLVAYHYIHQSFMKSNFRKSFDFVLHLSILWIASSELISWLDIMESTQSYKLGLSILWGVYALVLIILGIWKQKKHLRIGAIVLFGVTLIKLFAYDISHLDTIAKTIVFVALGILLLIISFLYTKYKQLISDEDED